jgi:hypothetical protein
LLLFALRFVLDPDRTSNRMVYTTVVKHAIRRTDTDEPQPRRHDAEPQSRPNRHAPPHAPAAAATPPLP